MVTVPKLVSETLLQIQNLSVKVCYPSKTSQWNLVTDPKLVSKNMLPIQIWHEEQEQELDLELQKLDHKKNKELDQELYQKLEKELDQKLD